jgi:hypothetical protein
MAAVIREAIEPADAALPALLECDRALVKIGKRIRVLKAIDWPVELEERFLMPPWARDPQRVLSLMALSAARQRLRLDRFDLQRFVDFEDEVIAECGTYG